MFAYTPPLNTTSIAFNGDRLMLANKHRLLFIYLILGEKKKKRKERKQFAAENEVTLFLRCSSMSFISRFVISINIFHETTKHVLS